MSLNSEALHKEVEHVKKLSRFKALPLLMAVYQSSYNLLNVANNRATRDRQSVKWVECLGSSAVVSASQTLSGDNDATNDDTLNVAT